MQQAAEHRAAYAGMPLPYPHFECATKNRPLQASPDSVYQWSLLACVWVSLRAHPGMHCTELIRRLSAVALEIVNSIFNRNAPKSEPVKEESSNSATDTEAQAAAAEKEAKKLEKDAKARMQAHADSVLEDILDE